MVNGTPPHHADAAVPLWAGLALSQPRIMGILNVTPDSFSDGGRHFAADTAIRAGLQMAADGADIIDIGGESTRPGAAAVSAAEEQARVLPVAAARAKAGLRVSIDTRNAATMAAALGAGAMIVNDVSGLRHDPDARRVVAEHGCAVVLMHMRGTPDTMNARAVYQDPVAEVAAELTETLQLAERGGVRRDRIVFDPGIGFAKLAPHSVAVLRGIRTLRSVLGRPLLVGVSRKSFLGRIANEPDPSKRVAGSIAAGLFALSQGTSILRVHDVRETVQAVRVWHDLSH
jgi:dihydropteroate synthase